MPSKVFFMSSTGNRLACRAATNGGFSLIEVMVTMVILAFGMLGIAGLLVGGVSNAASSEAMAKANQLASDMADRMRANPSVAISGSSKYIRGYGAAAPPSPTTTAENDVTVWLDALKKQLPSGDGKIEVDNPTRKVTISVRWSNCMGILNDTDRQLCIDNPATAFKEITFELRL